MTVSDSSLELRLVREGSCQGLLVVDSVRRSVRWDETDEPGCRNRFAVAFDDVETVRPRSDPGFLMEIVGAHKQRVVLLPLPHAAWLAHPSPVAEASGAWDARPGPPREVAADTRKAVDGILERLGRSITPAAALRDALYGQPVDTSLADVALSPGTYAGRAVRLRGRLEAIAADRTAYRVVDGTHALAAVPEAEIAAFIQPQVAAWRDQEVELVGFLRRSDDALAGDIGHLLSFWECTAGRETRPAEGQRTTLAALLNTSAASLGETVSVIGKFRGRNLFGDLPRQAKQPGDWVIKDDRYALWVTGRPQTDAGFTLDPGAPADTATWLEVVGTPIVRYGRVTLHARSVAVVPPPPGARALPPRKVLGRDTPPAVVFALPLEADPVAPDSRFIIQFSKDMEEESFRERIRLRYAAGPGEGEFRVTARYDQEHRSLVVDPGVLLRVGAQVEIALLPGIIDADGMPLEPRPGRQAEGAVDMLRYTVGGR